MKYILIKRYPGSPKLGTVYTRLNNHFLEDEGIPSKTFMDREFLNHWQEVVEKDYEILSVLIRRSDKHQQKIVDDDDSDDYIISLINCDGNSIHSVKRLSDGEIFAIGDEIYSTNWNCGNIDKKSDILTEISLNNEFMFKTKITWQCNLKDIQHYKQPLFTTEDGVDIFKSDNYWCAHNENFGVISMRWSVNHNPYVATNNIIYDYNTTKGKQKQHQNGNFYFSTKEKAEKYILMNKPCLSLNDIEFAIFKTNNAEEKRNKLKDLVKSKIQQSV